MSKKCLYHLIFIISKWRLLCKYYNVLLLLWLVAIIKSISNGEMELSETTTGRMIILIFQCEKKSEEIIEWNLHWKLKIMKEAVNRKRLRWWNVCFRIESVDIIKYELIWEAHFENECGKCRCQLKLKHKQIARESKGNRTKTYAKKRAVDLSEPKRNVKWKMFHDLSNNALHHLSKYIVSWLFSRVFIFLWNFPEEFIAFEFKTTSIFSLIVFVFNITEEWNNTA